MKTFKLKSILYSLSFLLTFVFLFPACTANQEENEIKPDTAAEQKLELNEGLLIPQDIASQGEEAMNNFVARATEEQLLTYQNNHIIVQYLKHYGKADEAITPDTDFSDLSTLQLDQYLNQEQMTALSTHLRTSLASAEARGCQEYVYWNPCCYLYFDNCQGCSVYTGIYFC